MGLCTRPTTLCDKYNAALWALKSTTMGPGYVQTETMTAAIIRPTT
jgi:hypothetical protein